MVAVRENVGPYRILRTLGQGGMGVVYEARDERVNRLVALKMLLPSTDGPDLRERLRREARTAAAVRHPHVCEIYEVGESDELYVAMELLEGEALSARISRGPIPVLEAIPFALQVLSALAALHDHAALHRDVKPSNVFITEHGVKLLDFGLAAPIETGARLEERLTLTGVVLGTPQYMAPERWTGEAQLGPESDLFAVGALLFEMVTGRAAFAGRSPVEVAQAVLSGPAPALEGGPGIDGLDRVVRTALAKRPADRYPTAMSMASALSQATEALTLSAQVRPTRPATRLLVFPFRLLRPDPDMEFLGHGIADAVTTALSTLRSLVVRSVHVAARFPGVSPDLAVVAREAGVDAVLVGTILCQRRAPAGQRPAPGGPERDRAVERPARCGAGRRARGAGRAGAPHRRGARPAALGPGHAA